jgi:glutamyl/glutaminyl-tRNA synthetase
MKLRSLLEIEYGMQDTLSQHMDQIKVKYGPEQYRQLQTLMSQQKDSEVEDWINHEKELGKLEDPIDSPPIDKAIKPSFRGKALGEQIREVIKREIIKVVG